MRRALVVAPAVLLLAVLGVGLFRTRPNAQLGRPAPDVALRPLTGDEAPSVRDLAGTPAVLNFWASWCEPCKDEAPELSAAHERYEGKVAFLGVSILDGRDEAREFVRRYGIAYPSGRDPSGSVSRAFGVTGVPETVFLDARGRVVGKYIGAFSDGVLDGLLERLLALPDGDLLDVVGSGESRPLP